MPFGKEKPRTSLKTILTELVSRTNDNTMRLRKVEQAIQSLEIKTDSMNKDSLDRKKIVDGLISEIKKVQSEQGKTITEFEKTMEEVVSHVKKLPARREIEELKELIEIYNPVNSNFVTREEVSELIEKRKKDD